MKKWIFSLLAVLLLLSGCVMGDPEGTTTMPQTTAQPTQPDPGLYDPDSTIEQQTSGAVRAYPLGDAAGSSITRIGEDILLFSYQENQTTVSRLTGENCSVKYTAQLGNGVNPSDGSMRVQENRIGYYDLQTKSVVFLDGMLQEIERVKMPEDMLATPVFSEDLNTVYYCTADSIRAMNLDTGISRLIRQQDCQWQQLRKVILNDTVLECYVIKETGNSYTEFISTATGETVGIDACLELLVANDEDYFLQRTEGTVKQLVFGRMGAENMSLKISGSFTRVDGLPSMNGVATVYYGDTTAAQLDLYDLESGLRVASVQLPENSHPYNLLHIGGYIWFLALDLQTQTDVLCRWDFAASPSNDTAVYTGPHYTRTNPDAQGLAQCQARADALSEQYGVKILLGEAVPQPEDYTFTYEYQVAAFQAGLDALEQALAKFPEGFFAPLENGSLRVGLVRQMQSLTQDAPADVNGLQYWLNGEACIALVLGDTVEQTFYHELSHVLDAHIYANSVAYDAWESLNPRGFQYDETYTLYAQRADKQYLEGESRAFVDEYSKTFAKEDRARILEYAMMEGNQELFASESMQRKLEQISTAIRDTYGWKKDEREFAWEKYLN